VLVYLQGQVGSLKKNCNLIVQDDWINLLGYCNSPSNSGSYVLIIGLKHSLYGIYSSKGKSLTDLEDFFNIINKKTIKVLSFFNKTSFFVKNTYIYYQMY
jgi:hypothetical protein